MLKIIIPDPGLREYGGHHPAMVNSLASTPAVVNGDIELDIYCNRDCNDEFINKSTSSRVKITKHFTTDFYQYFYQNPKLITLNDYIKKLALEYLSIFKIQDDPHNKNITKGSKTIFLYHTLNWEHATALATAISIYAEDNVKPLHHVAFLMFNPCTHNEKGHFNHTRFLNFKLGFTLLSKQKEVKYYAAEDELQKNYQYLLTHNRDVELHPCGLLNQSESIATKNKRVILFTGDAKVNKGFLTLPELLDKIVKEITDPQVEFVIQYTITNDNETLVQIDSNLQLQAKQDSRIKLTTSFWSHEELHSNFAKANCIIFNYDSRIYKNQSSGVLWLSAFYNINMVFLSDNWLMREAEKLGCEYQHCSKQEFSVETYKYLMQTDVSFDKVTSNKYRKILFQDIGDWLLNVGAN